MPIRSLASGKRWHPMIAMTNDKGESLLQTLADEREIHRVLMRYVRGSDRKDFALMRAAYHDDAFDDHGPFRGSIDAYMEWARIHHERFDQLMHLLGHPHIELSGRAALVETRCFLLQHFKAGAYGEGSPAFKAEIMCRYIDRFEDRGAGWKIAHRTVSYDWVRKQWLEEAHAPHPMAPGFQVSSRSSDDLIYQERARMSPPAS